MTIFIFIIIISSIIAIEASIITNFFLNDLWTWSDREKKSLALKRGNARRSRKTTRRKAGRLKKLIKLSKEFNLIDESFSRDSILKLLS